MKAYDSDEDEDYSNSSDTGDDTESMLRIALSMNPSTIEKKKLPRIILNVSGTQYSVVKDIGREVFCYKISTSKTDNWDLMWSDSGITVEMFSKMKLYQKINHFPTMNCLSRKNNLGKNLMRMKRYFAKDYNFFPATWLLPTDYIDFKMQITQFKDKTYIVKPEARSQGKGIFLIRSLEEIEPNDHYVVQSYIMNPYLIDGLKFDLRIYVLIYGCNPLRIFIYKEGLARLATHEYEAPNPRNLDNKYMHLTNYSINKNSENFVFNSDENEADVGHKRSLRFVWNYIDSHGGNSKLLKIKIQDLIVKTFCAVQPQLSHPYMSSQPNDIENNMCFEILGFDILIDNEMNPWLLEINHSPSFTADTPFDLKVKEDLIYDTIKLIRMDPHNRIKFNQQKDNNFKLRALGKSVTKLNKEKREEMRKKAMEIRDEYELENLGGYTRIYPSTNLDANYERFIEVAESLWEEFFGYKRTIPIRNEYKQGLAYTKRSSITKVTTAKNNGKARPSSRLPSSKKPTTAYPRDSRRQNPITKNYFKDTTQGTFIL